MRIVGQNHRIGIALLRVVVGIIFIWAGLDKLLGSGPTGFSAAGFLVHATGGSLGWPFVTGAADPNTIYNPTHQFWVSLAGNATAMTIVNFLVVAGELGVGISLILGLFTRFGALMGALMMLLFFFAGWGFSNGVVEEHLTYMVVLLALAGLGAGRYYGLDAVIGQRFSTSVRMWLFSGEEVPATI